MLVEALTIGHAAYDISVFLESFPLENTKCEIDTLVECGGGPAANAACLLSLWGVRTAFAGVVGDDRYATQIKAEFEDLGVNTSLLQRRKHQSTPLSVILVNGRNATRTIINRKRHSAPLQLDFARARELSPKLLLFDGHELEASLQAIELFPKAISILDAGSLRPGTKELAGKVNVLAASERFASQVTGIVNIASGKYGTDCIAQLLRLFGQKSVIVTLGEKGLIAMLGNEYVAMPAYPVQAIDTTGAGDVFHGALAYGILKGLSESEQLQLASMAASLSVRIAGGRRSIPKLSEVKEALVHVQHG